MPKTSDGREFPYTSDGIRAAQAHQRMLDKQKNQKTMGKAGDKTTGMPSIPFKPRPGPSEPDESYKGYRGGGAAPKVPPRAKRASDARLLETNDPYFGNPKNNLFGMRPPSGASEANREITRQGIENEKRLKGRIKLQR